MSLDNAQSIVEDSSKQDSPITNELIQRYEKLFTLTPEKMRSIVDAFVEALRRGLEKDGQVVVRPSHCCWFCGSSVRLTSRA